MAEEKEIQTTGQELHKAGTTMKEGIVNSLKGINEIEAEIVTLARNTVSQTLRATGDVAKEGFGVTTDVIKGAIQAQRAWPKGSSWESATSEVIS
jgi:hypothetical protein